MIRIRPLAATDLPAVRQLLSQLGYELGTEEVEQRYHAVARAEGHAAIVAERDGRVAAFLHVFARPAFEKPTEAIVQALVVDVACRGEGIGKLLMAAVEAWAIERGLPSVALSTNTSRTAAHAFYHALGYDRQASSHLLRKRLRASPHTAGTGSQ